MKLFLLRHQIRGPEQTFYSPLLIDGLYNSNKLKYILENLNINFIFSSPFIRCLQTVKPYCLLCNLNVNKEIGLYESIDFSIFDKDNYKIDITENDKEFSIINKNYNSYINLDEIEPENIGSRILKFKKYLLDKYMNTDYNILLVSHQTPINYFLERDDIRFPMGTLYEVIDIKNNIVKNIFY
tara:strand:+ start:79 stop:627 length:549 start_codon:yes stop_codon:yes gene_type:complete